jgi:DinB superfamily
MKAKDVIRQTIEMANMITGKYLEDLDDAAFLSRPVAGMNHIAWQVGHLISSEREVMESIKPGSCPSLPEGFDAKHKKETSTSDDPKAFCSKDEYMALWQAQRAATVGVLEALDEADLDAPAPERIRQWCPTVGNAMTMMGGLHSMMHVGQYVAVRRLFNKPITM